MIANTKLIYIKESKYPDCKTYSYKLQVNGVNVEYYIYSTEGNWSVREWGIIIYHNTELIKLLNDLRSEDLRKKKLKRILKCK